MGLRGPKPASLEEARRNRARVRPRNVATVAAVGVPVKRDGMPEDRAAVWDEIVPRLVNKGRVGEDDGPGLEVLCGLIVADRLGEKSNPGELFRWMRAFGMVPDSPIKAKDAPPKNLNNVEQFLKRG